MKFISHRQLFIPECFTLFLCLFANIASGQESGTHVQTGGFELEGTITQIAGEASGRAAELAIPLDEVVSWNVFVPENYSPDNPPGLLVYISPTPSGKILYKWKPVLEQENIIWIAANNSGNKVPVARRAVFAVTAVEAIKNDFSIDPDRVYLSGFSGGGKTASMIAPGASHSKLMVIGRMGHRLPEPPGFSKAIEFLDSRSLQN